MPADASTVEVTPKAPAPTGSAEAAQIVPGSVELDANTKKVEPSGAITHDKPADLHIVSQSGQRLGVVVPAPEPTAQKHEFSNQAKEDKANFEARLEELKEQKTQGEDDLNYSHEAAATTKQAFEAARDAHLEDMRANPGTNLDAPGTNQPPLEAGKTHEPIWKKFFRNPFKHEVLSKPTPPTTSSEAPLPLDSSPTPQPEAPANTTETTSTPSTNSSQ